MSRTTSVGRPVGAGRRFAPLMAALLLAAGSLPIAQARPDGPPPGAEWRGEGARRDGVRDQPPGLARGHEREVDRGRERGLERGHERGPVVVGHERRYPRPDVVVRAAPPRAVVVPWHGVGYRFHEGVWYGPAPHGWRVVRAPHGAVVPWLPVFRTVVVVGGLSYLMLNDTWYRERSDGGYEVVPPPAEAPPSGVPAQPERLYVYPARGQSAQVQAADEYDCHRWAARQSGYDPTAQATGQGPIASPAQRDDYRRAQVACLEGRGYTVK